MNVEIINVGTELLLGEIVNTNATYLQKMCKDLGFNVYYQSVVGDNPDRFKQCLATAFDRGADCVITTGGLGPTQDDLTKELSAEFLGLEMVYDQKQAKEVDEKCRFVTGLDSVPDNNFKQAYFPKGCFVLENQVGTANGCVMEKDGRMIINLPGPPKEMTYVVDHELVPYLSRFKCDVIYTWDYITMGIGESVVDELLKDLIHNQDTVTIALYASEETVRIRLGCKAPDRETADERMKPIKQRIETQLAPYILEENNLQEALKKILPPYRVIYKSDFRFRDQFLLCDSQDDAELEITVSTAAHPLGEIVQIAFAYKGRSHDFEVPLLKKAELSYSKLEARVVSQLYAFLRRRDGE